MGKPSDMDVYHGVGLIHRVPVPVGIGKDEVEKIVQEAREQIRDNIPEQVYRVTRQTSVDQAINALHEGKTLVDADDGESVGWWEWFRSLPLWPWSPEPVDLSEALAGELRRREKILDAAIDDGLERCGMGRLPGKLRCPPSKPKGVPVMR